MSLLFLGSIPDTIESYPSLKDGLAALWDPRTVVPLDLSLSGRAGTQVGGVTHGLTLGADGWSTDGTDDYLDFGPTPSLHGVTQFTLTCWFYRGGDINVDLQKSDGVGVYQHMNNFTWNNSGAGAYAGTFRVYMANLGAANGSGYYSSSGTGWRCFSTRYNGAGATNADRLHVFENGLKKTLTYETFNGGGIPSSTSTSTNTLRFGYEHYAPAFVPGTCGGVVIHSRQLTDQEIFVLSNRLQAVAWQPRQRRPEFRRRVVGSAVDVARDRAFHRYMTAGNWRRVN